METFLYSYYLEQLGRFEYYLCLVAGKHSAGDIHQLRLTIKKIRSVYVFLENTHPKEFNYKDHYRLFKPLFKTLGYARERQINLRLMKQIKGIGNLSAVYKEYVSKSLKVHRINILNTISTFSKESFEMHKNEVEGLLNRYVNSELEEVCVKFLHSGAGKVRLLSSYGSMTVLLHEIRVIIKNMKPLLLLLKDSNDLPFSNQVFRRLNRTETNIGRWHDWFVLKDSMTDFHLSYSDSYGKMAKEFKKLFKVCDREMEMYEQSIMTLLEKMLEAFHV